jgi:hypothetical protein
MRTLAITAVTIASLNAAAVTLLSGYDLHLGPIHLVAHGLFKPILYVSAAVLLAALVSEKNHAALRDERGWSPNRWFIAAAVVLLYLPGFPLHFDNNDWSHYYTSSAIRSVSSVVHLFTSKQPDGFYRPLAFLSLWIDYAIFGMHAWGYHLQNVALHIANAWLVARLALRLGLDRVVANFGALLFATAAVNYEPVLWPGARFDLLATFFTLAALLTLVRYLKDGARHIVTLVGMLALFVAGALSKESAYSFPLLAAFLLLTHTSWNLPSLPRESRLLFATAISVVTLALIGIRLVIYSGLGGYPDASGVSPHFELRMTTFTSFFTRALPVPLFAPNTENALPVWTVFAVLGFAAWACLYAFQCGGARWRSGEFVIAALLAALPAANLVDWVGPMMHNTRYMYLPSIWIFLLIATAAGTGPRARRILILLAIVNAIGVLHNITSFHWIDPGVRPVAQVVIR